MRSIGSHQPKGILHLPDAGVFAARPYFGSEEEARAQSCFRAEIADHAFGAPVHRRAVDHGAAFGSETAQHLRQRCARAAVVADVEGLISPQADHRQAFAAGGDGAANEARCGR